jgi:hypothetical protein
MPSPIAPDPVTTAQIRAIWTMAVPRHARSHAGSLL